MKAKLICICICIFFAVKSYAFVITADPADLQALEGDAVTLTIDTIDAGLYYQWQKDPLSDGTWGDITGATDSSYVIAGAILGDSGSYRCLLRTNPGGQWDDTSDVAVLVVIDYVPPQITDQPDSTTIMEGDSATFTVVATGTALTYQWQADAVDITGATEASYNTGARALADDGTEFRCIVSNDSGKDTSDIALLTVAEFVPSEWTYSAAMTVNTTPEWADIADTVTVTDFPMLVQLDSSYFDFSQVLANGEDLRFTKADGLTLLPYEIEMWDAAGGKAAIWVLMDTIQGNAEQDIIMYWGKADAGDASDGSAVFDTTNGFLGVWHLNEDGNTDSAGYADASGSGNHGTGVSFTADSDVNGVAGKAQDFDGLLDYIDLPDLGSREYVTVSCWFKQDAGGANKGLVSSGTWTSGDVHFKIDAGPLRADPMGTPTTTSGSAIVTGNWYYASYSRAASGDIVLYVNGEAVNSQAVDTNSWKGTNIEIGHEYTGYGSGDRYFDGIIDEVRIASSIRSPEWIKLNYENQKPGQSLISLPVVEGCVENFGVTDDTVQALEGGTASATGIAKCALRYHWSLVINDSTEVPVNAVGTKFLYTVGRISADTSLTYRFHALFDTGWAATDVVVEVLDNIPDPEFNLVSPFDANNPWDGRDTIDIQPFVTNLSAILASPAPNITYTWTTSGVPISSVKVDNTLTLRRAYGDGDLNIQLCADNGGAQNCKSIVVPVMRPLGIISQKDLKVNPVELQGSVLVWNRHAQVKIWSIEGRLVFNETGTKGRKLVLPPHLQRILNRHHQLVKILPLD